MLDAGSARAVMGNHEFNAIAWWTPDPLSDGQHLRPRHGPKGEQNRKQHAAFLLEVELDSAEHRSWIEWFYELPLWIEEPGFRVVHACWSPAHVERLRPRLRDGARLDEATLEAASRKGSEAYEDVEVILKGAEVELPVGHSFTDKDGHVRNSIRIRWWDAAATTYRQAYIGPPAEMPDLELDDRSAIPEPDRPTFIGHYWFEPTQPLIPVVPLRLLVGDVAVGVPRHHGAVGRYENLVVSISSALQVSVREEVMVFPMREIFPAHGASVR